MYLEHLMFNLQLVMSQSQIHLREYTETLKFIKQIICFRKQISILDRNLLCFSVIKYSIILPSFFFINCQYSNFMSISENSLSCSMLNKPFAHGSKYRSLVVTMLSFLLPMHSLFFLTFFSSYAQYYHFPRWNTSSINPLFNRSFNWFFSLFISAKAIMYGAFGMEAIPGINLWQILFISLGLIVASLYERHGEKKFALVYLLT